MYKNKFYKKYAKDVYSQNGEDGIVDLIIKKIKYLKWLKKACEFGAWAWETFIKYI